MTEVSATPSISNAPKDAAAVILLRSNGDREDPEVYWVKRSEGLAFLAGFHAFPGGQIDSTDSSVKVRNSPNQSTSTMISGAARELFEELGILVVRGGETLTRGQRESLLDDLESGRMAWPDLLAHYELQLDAHDFTFVGRWVTPPFNARRFDTWFFLVQCPDKQDPKVIPGELESGEWIRAGAAHQRWLDNSVVAVPPTLHALKTLAGGITSDLVDRFLARPAAHGEVVRRIEFRPNYICFPVRTPTRPPATHTNCYLVHTSQELLIFDPGSPYEEEQQALAECVDSLLAEGRTVREIIITHLHPDHVGGVNALRDHLQGTVSVAAHSETSEALPNIRVDRLIQDGEMITLRGEPTISLQAMHTPGHARGHLCFHDADHNALITGDNIVGLGSVLIDPPQGDMTKYLASLKRMRSIANLNVLFGGHGPAIATPYKKIDEYISHRLERETRILDAVRHGIGIPEAIVKAVYTDISPKAYAMAERSVIAHLEKLMSEGLVQFAQNRYLTLG
ncbi:MAG TPA: MBL fold metallo-hydrolase [Pyrinomonadaceae bacterium]|nr:MBL fold metallo-hydrolase [Pyrinomonadaceae bacterium]